MSNNIKVVCRFRPPNSIEMREGGDIVVSFDDEFTTVQLKAAQLSMGPEKDGFTFDRIFPMGTKQVEVFDYGVKGCVFLSAAEWRRVWLTLASLRIVKGDAYPVSLAHIISYSSDKMFLTAITVRS